MGYCYVPGCNHENRTHKRKMFPFPRQSQMRKKWMTLVRRAQLSPKKSKLLSPNKNALVCSCHFEEGDKERLPSIFPWNKSKRFEFMSPEKKRRRSKLLCTVRALNFDDKSHSQSMEECMDDPSIAVNLPASEQLTQIERPSFQNRENVDTSFVAAQGPLRKYTEASVQTDIDMDNLDEIKSQYSISLKTVSELKKKLAEATSVVHEAENVLLKSELEKVKKELDQCKGVFLFRTISETDHMVSHYTGLPNKQTFFALLHVFDTIDIQYAKGWKVARFSKVDQLFMTLVKLRRGLSNKNLATRFKVEKSTVSNIFVTWVMALHHVLVKNLLLHLPSRRKNKRSLPVCFKEFPSTGIILDCTEVSTANPTLLSNQSKMYSSYKHRITSKALVGIAPNGTVTFVSELFAGSTSDRNIVIASGILDKLVPGDTIMADKDSL